MRKCHVEHTVAGRRAKIHPMLDVLPAACPRRSASAPPRHSLPPRHSVPPRPPVCDHLICPPLRHPLPVNPIHSVMTRDEAAVAAESSGDDDVPGLVDDAAPTGGAKDAGDDAGTCCVRADGCEAIGLLMGFDADHRLGGLTPGDPACVRGLLKEEGVEGGEGVCLSGIDHLLRSSPLDPV